MTKEEAIKILRHWGSNTPATDRDCAVKMAIEALEKLEPQWIPVEQELPEYGKAVLTITQDETYEVNHVIDEECGEWFWEDNGKVIAWMPLPEPFKGVTS